MKNLSRQRRWLARFIAAYTFCAIATLSVATAQAQEMPTDGGSMQGGAAPADARDPDYSDGFEYRGMAGWEETDDITFAKVIFDQLELRSGDGTDALQWDIQGWRGTDYRKIWFKFEGEDELSDSAGDFELQALFSRTIAPFWDVQIGARYERQYGAGPDRGRSLAVIGLQGLAPYWFELEPALFVSEDGDISARITATYDLLITQRLIVQPRLEANVAATKVRDFGVGSGLNDVQLGVRLRYEYRREVAPYIGLSWQRQFGNTADLTRGDGGDIDDLAFVAGLRVWF